MQTTSADATRTARSGDIIEVSAEEGKDLIAGNYAVEDPNPDQVEDQPAPAPEAEKPKRSGKPAK